MSKRTARQKAIASGKEWYKPDVPCKHCGTRALKRVNNGECQGCVSRPEKLPESPDGTVMSREQAKEFGFSTYFTGNECVYGHKDKRYVSNRKCVTCHKEAALEQVS